MNTCLSCSRGFYFECGHTPPVEIPQVLISPVDDMPRTRRLKDEVTVSAGRKRAAAAYKVDSEAPCEWRNLAECGGGLKPIVGCINGFQRHRHHGPVKNTTHNERLNIHLICHRCHNTWHAKNDPVYVESTYADLPHNPREATPQDWEAWVAAGGKLG